MPRSFAFDLHQALEAVAPITGVAVGDPDDRGTWEIRFADAATEDQKAAARAALAAFVPPA